MGQKQKISNGVKELKIAVYHNLPDGGAKKAISDAIDKNIPGAAKDALKSFGF